MNEAMRWLRGRWEDRLASVLTRVATPGAIAELQYHLDAAEMALGVLDEHDAVLDHVEWPHAVDSSGRAYVCASCRPADPTPWSPVLRSAEVLPEWFVPSYVLWPCPTVRVVARPVMDDTSPEALR